MATVESKDLTLKELLCITYNDGWQSPTSIGGVDFDEWWETYGKELHDEWKMKNRLSESA